MDAARPQKPKPTPFELWARDRQRDTVVVKRATRGDPGASNGFGRADLVGPRKVLAVQFADGSVFFTDPVEYARTHGQTQTSRSADGDGEARVLLPFEIAHQGPVRRGGNGERTPIDRYTISELTEPTTLDRIYDFTISLGGLVGRWIGSIGGRRQAGQARGQHRRQAVRGLRELDPARHAGRTPAACCCAGPTAGWRPLGAHDAVSGAGRRARAAVPARHRVEHRGQLRQAVVGRRAAFGAGRARRRAEAGAARAADKAAAARVARAGARPTGCTWPRRTR